ncbi:sulfotransferase [Actinomadura sp. GTD37]|uniref:sulfotransferase family protein n=1 Tax=Actinomadura sp. GTD37 TaxID=1778030 RepID=UPI0035BFF463
MSAGRDSVGTVEDLHASAGKVTGMDDFGGDEYLDGLKVLLESMEKEAGLTPLGNKAHRAMLRGALAARLFSEASWKRHPEYADVPIERPVFVTGLPRTGTTALHRLLTADPGHQGLDLWLSEMPQPRPPRETWADNPVFQAIDAAYRRHHIANPEFMGVHYISADSVEECWQLLRQSMTSISYESLAHVPSYSSWLAAQDWTPAYRRHRANLQLIGLNDVGRRWVLKNPSHLFALDALLDVYPDALIIQTHRTPRTAMASMCSLAAHVTAGWSDLFTGAAIGSAQLELWSRGLDQFHEARARHNPEQFADVYYDDFVRDPIGTVATVYARFGLPFTDEARTAMAELHGESRSGAAKPSHRYSLADFGLTAGDVDERFADYSATLPT